MGYKPYKTGDLTGFNTVDGGQVNNNRVATCK